MEPYDNGALAKAIGELGVLNQTELDKARLDADAKGIPLGDLLVERDLLTDENLGRVVADLIGCPAVRLAQVAIPGEILRLIPEVTARKQKIVAFGKDDKGLKLAMANPADREVAGFVEKKTGDPVVVYYATKRDIEQALSLYRKDLQKTFDEMIREQVSEAGKVKGDEAPVRRLVDLLIEYAYANRASDVHIEPEKKQSIVRFRVDGVLHDVLVFPRDLNDQVVLRIKVAAKLRTDEKMAPQDGKMQVELESEDLDIRVSVVPVVNGEKVVLRLLSSKARQFGLADLGMGEADLMKVRGGFAKPYGMVLCTGPTGSGKTTTIYSILKQINRREINIATIEDPVEYDIEGINQIQVNPKTNLTFATGLRAILRQDPNVIFVGEIRDQETADIAVNSAMTGHLVLSTPHTNDAATTLPRLTELGVEPFLVASTVNVILAQRLVRKTCVKCRVSREIPWEELAALIPRDMLARHCPQGAPVRAYAGKGCPVCYQSGYQGRVGTFEVLMVTEGIRELIVAKSDFETIKNLAVREGMSTMLEDGLEKVLSGMTTVEEVLRVTKE